MRRNGHLARARFGAAEEASGWLFGPREKGWIACAFGGLGANIPAGVIALIALLASTLPFTVLLAGSGVGKLVQQGLHAGVCRSFGLSASCPSGSHHPADASPGAGHLACENLSAAF